MIIIPELQTSVCIEIFNFIQIHKYTRESPVVSDLYYGLLCSEERKHY